MAEIGIAASLIGITGAAIDLVRTLYVFGSTTSAAREQVDYIRKNVSFYSDVLELLVEQFEHDRPIHSKKAIALAEKLHDHSYDLFGRIRDLMPDGRRIRDQISFLQKIAWNFKKTKVDLLVGELENLKSTVQLLVQVLCAARQIHAYQADCGKSNGKRKNKKKREAVNRQCRRAENVIVEWQRTQETLTILQDAAERSDLLSIQPGRESEQSEKPLRSKDAGVLIRGNETTLAVIEATAAAAGGSEADKRALVLKNTTDWLEKLIHEWTVPPSPELFESVDEAGLSESEDIARAQSMELEEQRRRFMELEEQGRRFMELEEQERYMELEEQRQRRHMELEEQRRRRHMELEEQERYMELEEQRRYTRLLEQEQDRLRSKQRAMGSSETSKSSEATPRAFHFSTDGTLFEVRQSSSALGEDAYGARGERAEANPKGNAIPNRGAHLKHAETHDSGYGESGGKPKPELPRRSTSRREEDKDGWHAYHGSAKEYIERSQRPGVSGRTSSSRSYWEPLDDRQSGRKNDSDNDKRPGSSKGSRPSIDVLNARPPAIPSQNSAPAGVATINAQLEKDGSRSQTMPSSKPHKGDAMPFRSSNLKHAETHDSGYGSFGGRTPDLSGTSPPRPTRYQVVEDEDDVSTILVDPEDRYRRTPSPSPPTRERDRRNRLQRPIVPIDSRPRSSRGVSYQ